MRFFTHWIRIFFKKTLISGNIHNTRRNNVLCMFPNTFRVLTFVFLKLFFTSTFHVVFDSLRTLFAIIYHTLLVHFWHFSAAILFYSMLFCNHFALGIFITPTTVSSFNFFHIFKHVRLFVVHFIYASLSLTVCTCSSQCYYFCAIGYRTQFYCMYNFSFLCIHFS